MIFNCYLVIQKKARKNSIHTNIPNTIINIFIENEQIMIYPK